MKRKEEKNVISIQVFMNITPLDTQCICVYII